MLKSLLFGLLSVGLTIYIENKIIGIPLMGYVGVGILVLMASYGSAKGIISITKFVSGCAIKAPRVGTRSVFGFVVCEANFAFASIAAMMIGIQLRKHAENYVAHYILFSACVIIASCSYFSSVSVGIICGAITMMDAKDSSLFFKNLYMEILPAGICVMGFAMGMILKEKANGSLG